MSGAIPVSPVFPIIVKCCVFKTKVPNSHHCYILQRTTLHSPSLQCVAGRREHHARELCLRPLPWCWLGLQQVCLIVVSDHQTECQLTEKGQQHLMSVLKIVLYLSCCLFKWPQRSLEEPTRSVPIYIDEIYRLCHINLYQQPSLSHTFPL